MKKTSILVLLLIVVPNRITLASWYARGLKHPDALTVASRDYPKGTKLMLRISTRKPWVPVVVNDYGPDPKIHPDRGLDVSRGVARKLGIVKRGLALVEVKEAP